MRGQPVAGGVHLRDHHGQHHHDEPRGGELIVVARRRRPRPRPSASPALASRTIKLSGEAGSFPLPAGAKVAENVAGPEGTIVFFDQVTPAKVSSFYAQALPRAGYTITANSVISQSGSNVAFIQFTGHGIKGTIDALARFTDSSVSIAGLGHKNVTTISITQK